MSSMKNIIFGYSYAPSNGCFGVSDGGFSVELYTDGSFIYKTYIFDMRENKKRKMMLSMETVGSIKDVLIENAGRIKTITNRLDNGSMDGSCNTFIFFEKEIIDYNISFNDEQTLRSQNSTYYDEYESVIKQENLILQIFEQVVEKLKHEGITLTLQDVDFNAGLL